MRRARHQISIQVTSRTVGNDGVVTDSWSEAASAWASIRAIAADDRMLAGGVYTDVTHEMRCRVSNEVTPTLEHKITWDSRTFDVAAIYDREERGRYWTILCREVTQGNTTL